MNPSERGIITQGHNPKLELKDRRRREPPACGGVDGGCAGSGGKLRAAAAGARTLCRGAVFANIGKCTLIF